MLSRRFRFERMMWNAGQGGFFSERVDWPDPSHSVNVVYDCGSHSPGKDHIDTLVDRWVSMPNRPRDNRRKKLDVLVISHFDHDHINGIPRLKNKCRLGVVVIPFRAPSEIAFDIARVLVNSGVSPSSSAVPPVHPVWLAASPADFLDDGTVVLTVGDDDAEPVVGEGDGVGLGEGGVLELEGLRASRSIRNGVALAPTMREIPWRLIPVSLRMKERMKVWEDAVMKAGLSMKEMGSVEYQIENLRVIKKVYGKMRGGTNGNCLMLLSKVSAAGADPMCPCRRRTYGGLHGRACFRCEDMARVDTIYMGDAKGRSRKDAAEEIWKHVHAWKPRVGKWVVAHHGGSGATVEVPWTDHFSCAVVPFGSLNRYGHPRAQLLGELAASTGVAHLLTEDDATRVRSFWRLSR